MATELATLAGGCFWCLEAVYLEIAGIEKVASGYMGGHVANPTYEQVCSKKTGHTEVVQLTFDPEKISYSTLLEVFFTIHDPTTRDRQGNDVGPQYRSAIFTHLDEQARIARDVIASLDVAAVTEVTPASEFWPAEDYHQNYFAMHGTQPYCMFVVSPKVKKFREKFSRLRRTAQA